MVESNARLENVRKELRRIKGIEPGIFECVAALRYCCFNTTGSCGGHYRIGSRMYPWVLVYPSMPDPWAKLPSNEKHYTPEFLEAWKREFDSLKHHVGAFNSLRHGTPEKPVRYPEDEKLEVYIGEGPPPPHLLVMIRPRGAMHLDAFPRELIAPEKAERIIRRYRRVMKRFGEYIVAEFDRREAKGRPF